MDLEKELRRLPRIQPTSQFRKDAKQRLMHQIQVTENEVWFISLLRKVGLVNPSPEFIRLSRTRLMARITMVRRSVFGWGLFLRRVLASTMVMVLAVTTVLFSVDGRQIASASEDSIIDVIAGQVTLKHADNLVWDVVPGQAEVAAGDLIRTADGAQATIRFFDDSELRLAGNSTVLINRLTVSPGFARQGVIEVILSEGRAWVQTLNVDDGHAGFALITRDLSVAAQHASFDVAVSAEGPTALQVYKYGVRATVLEEGTQRPLVSASLTNMQKVRASAVTARQNSIPFNYAAQLGVITKADRQDGWVRLNLERDQHHLTIVREQELANLRQSVGVLPGQLLYPVKQIKERLKLALSLDGSAPNAMITIANKRLQEAIVLMENGEAAKAQEALIAYQAAVQQVADAAKTDETLKANISRNLIARNQKTLVAALPQSGSPINVISETLNETEELLATTDLERERLRIENTRDGLLALQDLVASGNLRAAKDLLTNQEVALAEAATSLDVIDDKEVQKTLLDELLTARNEQYKLLADIRNLTEEADVDAELATLLSDVQNAVQSDISRVAKLVAPFKPEVTVTSRQPGYIEQKAALFVDKVYIYSTTQGQLNQINRLLKADPVLAHDLKYLNLIRDGLTGDARNYMNTKILQVQSYLESKSEAVGAEE